MTVQFIEMILFYPPVIQTWCKIPVTFKIYSCILCLSAGRLAWTETWSICIPVVPSSIRCCIVSYPGRRLYLFSLREYRGKGEGCPCPWREATWWDEGCRSLINHDTRLRRVVDFTPATVGASWSLEPKFPTVVMCMCLFRSVFGSSSSSILCIRHVKMFGV